MRIVMQTVCLDALRETDGVQSSYIFHAQRCACGRKYAATILSCAASLPRLAQGPLPQAQCMSHATPIRLSDFPTFSVSVVLS
mgnify:CR=1 FL=1